MNVLGILFANRAVFHVWILSVSIFVVNFGYDLITCDFAVPQRNLVMT